MTRTIVAAAVFAGAVAVTLASVAAAGPAGTKQRVAINMKLHRSTFVLTPLQTGALNADSGTVNEHPTGERCRDVLRAGQKASICTGGQRILTGKQGTLTIRERVEWVDPGSPGCGIAYGTWTIARGTGVYAGIVGGGRNAYDAHCEKWYARYEGVLTVQ